jgi:hypothetical protein
LPVTERLRVRQIDDDEGRRLVRIIRRGRGSVVTWRRARDVIRNFNATRRAVEAARLVDGAAWLPVSASACRRPRSLASERIAQ